MSTRASSTRGVIWCPYDPSLFLASGAGLHFYRVARPAKDLALSDVSEGVSPHPVSLLGSSFEENFWRATVLDWQPRPSADEHGGHVLAIAGQDGTVRVSHFLTNEHEDGPVFYGKREFSTRTTRQISALAFNPTAPHLLAMGLEKAGREPSIMLWDLTNCHSSLGDSKLRSIEGLRGTKQTMCTEITFSEGFNSLSWLHGPSETLVAGFGSKHLRTIDFRTGKTANTVHGQFTHCVCVDSEGNYLAAYSPSASMIRIFDARHMDEKGVCTFSDCRSVTRMSWCPTRTSLLAVLSDRQQTVQLFDIHCRNATSILPNDTTWKVNPSSTSAEGVWTAGLSWHPLQFNRMLTISTIGVINDFAINEKTTTSFSPRGEVAIATGNEVLTARCPLSHTEDIAAVMRRRASEGYGSSMDCNLTLTQSDARVNGAWRWVQAQQQRSPELKGRGLRAVAVPDGKSGLQASPHAIEGMHNFLAYDAAPARATALAMCGWPVLEPCASAATSATAPTTGSAETSADAATSSFPPFVEVPAATLSEALNELEAAGDYERAAMLAVFSGDVPRASKTLASMDGAQSLVAATISVLACGASEVWRQLNSDFWRKLPSPHLRAIFAFLTSTDRRYKDVFEETGIALTDRIAFACRFLSDEDLGPQLSALAQECTEKCNLAGLALTGWCKQGLELIDAYVDRTADVQTASLLVCLLNKGCTPVDVKQHPRVRLWMEAYREFLDSCQLWVERSRFDCLRVSATNTVVPSQVSARCNFCSQSLSFASLRAMGGRSSRSSLAACSGCRRPLPRCAICFLRLGSVPPQAQSQSKATLAKPAPFDTWFAWCHSCHHGGHVSHMSDWFKANSVCPVMGCHCLCQSRDRTLPLEAVTPHAPAPTTAVAVPATPATAAGTTTGAAAAPALTASFPASASASTGGAAAAAAAATATAVAPASQDGLLQQVSSPTAAPSPGGAASAVSPPAAAVGAYGSSSSSSSSGGGGGGGASGVAASATAASGTTTSAVASVVGVVPPASTTNTPPLSTAAPLGTTGAGEGLVEGQSGRGEEQHPQQQRPRLAKDQGSYSERKI